MAAASLAQIPFVCRLRISDQWTTNSPDDEFCAFEFPSCAGCPKAGRAVQSVAASDDPMNSKAWRNLREFPIAR
jgi:hypothetical protein